MNPETAELTLPEPAPRACPAVRAFDDRSRGPARGRSAGGAARLAGRRCGGRVAHAGRARHWRALWTSRLLVWVAGVGTMLAFGFGPVRTAFNPPGVTRGFGRLGDLLAAPAARWDAAWYLVIAHDGYRPSLGAATASRTAFFPLYPLGLRAISLLGFPPVLAGVLLSVCALALALYGIHRLTTLELGGAGLAIGAGGRDGAPGGAR